MNKTLSLATVSLLALAACAQQKAAQVEQKGEMYYGRYETFQGGREVPKYSDENRAVQDQAIVTKYLGPKHEYSIPAEVPEVEIHDLVRAPRMAPMSVTQVAQLPQAPAGDAAADDLQLLAPLPDPQSVRPAVAKADKLEPLNNRASNFIWPAEGKVVSRFGPKKNGLVNDGINISAREGSPIWASANGEVVYSGNEMKGYGNMIILRHRNGWMTAYAHASDLLVKKGMLVKQGDLLGYVGRTGTVIHPQLHFGIREGKTPVDPEELLPHRIASAN